MFFATGWDDILFIQMIRTIIDRDNIESPLRKSRELSSGKRTKVVADHHTKVPPLLAIDRGLGWLHIVRGAGFHFDEAEHISVPADQVNLSAMPRRPEVPRDDDVALLAKEKVRLLFAAPASEQMSGHVSLRGVWREAIEAAKNCLRDAGGEHEKENRL